MRRGVSGDNGRKPIVGTRVGSKSRLMDDLGSSFEVRD